MTRPFWTTWTDEAMPTAARPFFPYVEHRSMAVVMANEKHLENARAVKRQWYADNRKSWRRA